MCDRLRLDREYDLALVMNLILALLWMMHTASPPPADADDLRLRTAHSMLGPVDQEIERARSEAILKPIQRSPAPENAKPLPEPASDTSPSILASDVGEATHYGGRFHGRRTASGEIFDQNAMTAAHRTFPFGTIVRVINTENGRSVIVKINDRGPFGPAKRAARKIIDVSRAAARELGFYRQGRTVVRLEVLEWGEE